MEWNAADAVVALTYALPKEVLHRQLIRQSSKSLLKGKKNINLICLQAIYSKINAQSRCLERGVNFEWFI